MDNSHLLGKVERLERDLDQQKQLNSELISRILMLEQKVTADTNRSGSVVNTRGARMH